MTAAPEALSVEEAAARLGVRGDAVDEAIAAAVSEAEAPSVNMCHLPGPALEISATVGGRLIVARRSSLDAGEWLVALP